MRFEFLEHDLLTGSFKAHLLQDDGQTRELLVDSDLDDLHLKVLSMADPSERFKVNSDFFIVDPRLRHKITKPR